MLLLKHELRPRVVLLIRDGNIAHAVQFLNLTIKKLGINYFGNGVPTFRKIASRITDPELRSHPC